MKLPLLCLVGCLALSPACGGDDDGDGNASDAGATTLYDRLGQQEGIEAVMNDFVGRVVADSKINGYFLNASVDGARLTRCLVKQVGAATGGPQVFPDPDGQGDGCRNMKDSHAGLGISQADFDDLVGHLVASLDEAGVAQADIDTITEAGEAGGRSSGKPGDVVPIFTKPGEAGGRSSDFQIFEAGGRSSDFQIFGAASRPP